LSITSHLIIIEAAYFKVWELYGLKYFFKYDEFFFFYFWKFNIEHSIQNITQLSFVRNNNLLHLKHKRKVNHTHSTTSSSGCLTDCEDGDVLRSIEPPYHCLSVAHPFHHGDIVFSSLETKIKIYV
jgi:hypothetical protein